MADTLDRPALPDGIVIVVKEECATCHSVGSVLVQLDGAATLTVYTQDDPNFPSDIAAVHDEDLAVSWHHGIETVPTVIRVVDGVEIERTVGWHRGSGSVSPESRGWGRISPRCGRVAVR